MSQPNGASRRTFLGAAGLTGIVAGAAALAGPAADADAATTTGARRYSLELGGRPAGGPSTLTGGTAVGVVVVDSSTSDGTVQRKHIGNVKYNDFVIRCATGMAPGFYDWISGFVEGKSAASSGRCTTRGPEGRVLSSLDFQDAFITELTIPALDGGSKDAGYLQLAITPSVTEPSAKAGPDQQLSATKVWRTGNFSLQIDGIDCSRVASIDSFTWKAVAANTGLPFALQVPDLRFTTPLTGSAALIDWYQTVIAGKTDRRNGELIMHDFGGKGEIFRVGLTGLGAYEVELVVDPEKHRPPILRTTVFCEQTSFAVGPGVASR